MGVEHLRVRCTLLTALWGCVAAGLLDGNAAAANADARTAADIDGDAGCAAAADSDGDADGAADGTVAAQRGSSQPCAAAQLPQRSAPAVGQTRRSNGGYSGVYRPRIRPRRRGSSRRGSISLDRAAAREAVAAAWCVGTAHRPDRINEMIAESVAPLRVSSHALSPGIRRHNRRRRTEEEVTRHHIRMLGCAGMEGRQQRHDDHAGTQRLPCAAV